MAVERIEPPASPHLPPHNLEAEQSVLGAMLVNPNAITAVAELLTADDFYRDTHRLIYRGVLTLFERGEEVDVVTISAQLEREGMLERAGGREFVHTLAEFVPAAANARALRRHRARAERAALAHPRGQRDRRARLPAPRRSHRPARPLRAEGVRHPAAAQRRRVRAHQAGAGAQLRAPRHPGRRPRRHRRRHRVRGHRQAHRRLPEGQPHRARRAPRRRQDEPRAQHRAPHGHRGPQGRTAASTRSPSSAWR